MGGFNPSVGILGVQAHCTPATTSALAMFQSLSRDSRRSSQKFVDHLQLPCPVSIPQSGFSAFKPEVRRPPPAAMSRFNPSVGILGVQAFSRPADQRPYATFQSLSRDSRRSSPPGRLAEPALCDCFNPSVGILGVQAASQSGSASRIWRFQSLSRDSRRSSHNRLEGQAVGAVVSIPQSGFSAFKPRTGHTDLKYAYQFQSLSRDSRRSSVDCSASRTDR